MATARTTPPSSPPATTTSAAAGLLDLEKELTCSICTEILYQPLTLLDCLHTFCGSCLKEWFGSLGRSSRTPRYTCPSCRAVVRETRPNATVTTLLDMYIQANPGKAKSAEEKAEIARTYRVGESVVGRGVGSGSESEDGVVEEVRQMSLREVGVGGGRSDGARARRREPEQRRREAEQSQTLRRSNGRPLGHQSSLRSLLNSTNVASQDMLEEVLRQIMEEGLLDGIDLTNMDIRTEDEVTERIAQVLRRRPGGLRPDESARRREISRGREEASRAQEQRRRIDAERTGGDGRTRPPISRPHLFEGNESNRHHRRSSSQGGTPTTRREDPLRRSSNEISRSAARSTSDLGERPVSREAREQRASVSQERRSTDPPQAPVPEEWRRAGGAHGAEHHRRPVVEVAPFQSPRPAQSTAQVQAPPAAPLAAQVQHVPSEISLPQENTSAPLQSPPARPSATSITCVSCKKQAIEHDVHYSCSKCGDASGSYVLCRRCYRKGVGCKHWYGFGYAAWAKYEQQAPPDGYPAGHEPPHMMRAEKYLRPGESGAVEVSGLNGASDPSANLQRGVFCDVCAANANNCHWRCEVCNDGEWGFCNTCVNQGRHCTHPLLPLAYELVPETSDSATPDFPFQPHHIPLRTTCNSCRLPIPSSHMRFHCPRCNGGDYDICYTCYNSLAVSGRISVRDGPNGWRRCPQKGHRMLVVGFEDREDGRRRVIVQGLVGGWAISDEEVDQALRDEQERQTQQGDSENNARSWKWRDPSAGAWKSKDRGLPYDLLSTVSGAEQLQNLPPSGGAGMHMQAVYGYLPEEGVTDELEFPRWAELHEVMDINGDWYWGVYCAKGGLFPGGFGRVVG